METMKAILSRRSIRKYKKDQVPPELIEELLKAAMSAPSAGNQRPWHFIIIDDRKILERIPDFHPHAAMMTEVPQAIVVCGDHTAGKIDDFWVQDCSAAAENLLLAMHDRGLGGVWLGVYPLKSRVKGAVKLLGLPKNIIPLCIIPFGYPAETKKGRAGFEKNKVHKNGW